jgi:hypothetical protein
MTRRTRQTGARCLRWLLLPAAFTALAAPAIRAQDAPPLTTQERAAFERFKSGQDKCGPESKPIFDKSAKYYVGKLNSSEAQRGGAEQGMSYWINDFDKRLLLPQHNYPLGHLHYSRLKPEQKQFVDEYGKAAIEALETPALKAGMPIVRINAARMVAEVCRSGYDGAADLCLKILAKPNESDAVKLYALHGLKNLFWIVPETLFLEKSIFQKDNTGNLSPLEQRSIQALADFIFRKPAGDLSADEADAAFYVRREAVRALALVRVQQVKNKNQVVSQPALLLLKVARGDGLTPSSTTQDGPDARSTGERIAAIIGFCNLTVSRDLDMNVDYAVYQVGRAIQDLAPLYQPGSTATSTPWKASAQLIRESLETWSKRAVENKLDNAQLIAALLAAADRDILRPIEEAQATSIPNAANFGEALQGLMPKSKSLFKSDPKSTINVP